MSFRNEYIMSLAGANFNNKDIDEMKDLFLKLLSRGLHGLCFGAYLQDQKPGSIISESQIRERLEIIKPYTKWIRTFSCTDGNELIPAIAKEYGIQTMVGAWLGDNLKKNKKEIHKLIEIAKAGNADLVAVGNEVLYREDLTEDELLENIRKVKKELPDVPVGYVDAYYEFCNRPSIVDACDVLFTNCYPFWEGCHIDYSLLYMKDMYHRVVNASKGKRVIISETGWPNQGTSFEEAEPSEMNAIKYFINAQLWSMEEDIEMFYFAAFDELWKISDEGDVGAFWGIWDQYGKLKFTDSTVAL